MYYKYPINDVHIHAMTMDAAEATLSMVEELGYEKFNMLSVASYMTSGTANNLLCAYIKLKSKGKGYAMAAVHYPEIGAPTAEDMLEQVKLYKALGFDGIKMMDGKPTMRRRTGIALNDLSYDPMFSYMEETAFPLLYHVNDPYEFWNWDLIPKWAKANGTSLFYGDGTYPTKEEIENEMIDILKKHPRLKIIIPHFFFTAVNYKLTKMLFDTYPNLSYDITPGWEMFESFAEDYDHWRQFFVDYSDRIVFGTDTYSDHWRDTVYSLRRVMETDDEFIAFEEKCKGFKLEGAPLKSIYYDNFYKFFPKEPSKININGLLEYGETLYSRVDNFKDVNKIEVSQNITECIAAIKAL